MLKQFYMYRIFNSQIIRSKFIQVYKEHGYNVKFYPKKRLMGITLTASVQKKF